MRATLAIAIIALLSLFNPAQADRLTQAVVKIHTTSAPPDYFTPWRLLNAQQSSGSGAVISGRRILTNAHVVADASYIQVQKHGDPRKFLAQVSFVSHAADLAIITLPDKTQEKSFFDGIKPLKVGKLPKPREKVSVYGYPIGGISMSITEGILSRIEHQYYAHAGAYLLAGQIDAAINPGNSGGPVIVDGKIAGVVMQANAGHRAENLGYFVPPSVIRHVLKDAQDGVNNGFSDLGFRAQSLESPAVKAAQGLSEKQQGILVIRTFSESINNGKVLEGDVITRIGGKNIAEDMTIDLGHGVRTDFSYVIDQLHSGETTKIELIRKGEPKTVTLTAESAKGSQSLVRAEAFDQRPEYVIVGGVVFVPLNMNLIKRWGRDWRNKAPIEFLNARNIWRSPDKRELVVALKVLPADSNLGYHDWQNWPVAQINGEDIRDFADFRSKLAASSNGFITLTDDSGYRMVINRKAAAEEETEILERYRVPSSAWPALDKTDPAVAK